jgi:ElaA protein
MSSFKLNWHELRFEALTTKTLYAILKIRQEVFAVAQNSIYLDVDGKDIDALHIIGAQDDVIHAYCRILPPGVKYSETSIGRVLTSPEYRGNGTGKLLMQHAIQCCSQQFPDTGIRISAQLYLQRFYEDFGFAVTTEPYDEDGIPHIEMLKPSHHNA